MCVSGRSASLFIVLFFLVKETKHKHAPFLRWVVEHSAIHLLGFKQLLQRILTKKVGVPVISASHREGAFPLEGTSEV